MKCSDSDACRDLWDDRRVSVKAVWVALGSRDAHVAALAPRCSPRITDFDGAAVVAHCDDGMINLAGATLVEHS